jgi:predicted metal-dependent hydrolase
MEALNHKAVNHKASDHQITVSGLTVAVCRKAIKNLHLGVYPPEGRVRVAAPLAVSDEAVRLAVVQKLGWIRRQQAKFAAQPRQSQRAMVDRESHYFMGQRYLLRVVPHKGAAKIVLRPGSIMELHIRPETTTEQRERVLQRWYREQLKQMIPPLLEKWQPVLGVQATDWSVRKMKTKWGTCSHETGRIRLNIELAKKSSQCLEYIVVHELLHLIERKHNERFITLQDKYLLHWKLIREELNSAPLAHEDWNY